jgi:fluoroquinolone resistance protein
VFRTCKLIDVDFSDGDLTSVEFDDCELERANFSRANLSKADLRSAIGFSIDPTSSILQGARFSKHNLEGLVTTFGVKLE